MHDFEKLGAFYLGREIDPATGSPSATPVLYDAKDLTTHAVCVGMTGSGKTGLCVSLLEEAALDGVPSIAIDPKGDLPNLLLTFPELRAEDFRPWVDEQEAQRKGLSVEQFAQNRAEVWRNGLADWGQSGERIARLRAAADVVVYTPGSNAGLELSVLRSFDPPPEPVREDSDAMRERVGSTVGGLLGLLGLDADPVRSRDHILLSTILDGAWREGRGMDFGRLIAEVQSPRFDRVGVLDLESFYSARERFGLAMGLNNLIASPVFSAWTRGEPLSVDRLLYAPDGRPRVSIVSIAHLSDRERMFFVTMLLNEVLTWVRGQSGTGSLRALLYMDEVFGFFPPVAEPPSKRPMLTLLKQARAYGLGCVLATQNPVDLDYKGLSNAGTWFLGRLQTERDKARVLEGLQGASAASGPPFDGARMDALLSGLGSRVFLMHNVHESAPTLFQSRWAMSYLRGPMTRDHIRTLMADRRGEAERHAAAERPVMAAAPAGASDLLPHAPPVPPDVPVLYLPLSVSIGDGEALLYEPALLARARLHYVRVAAQIDEWREEACLSPLRRGAPADPWADRQPFEPGVAGESDDTPDSRGRFAALPSGAAQARQLRAWESALRDELFRTRELTLLHAPALKIYSRLGESERDFRIRLRDAAHEQRDAAMEKLRASFGPKRVALQERLRKAEQRVEVEKDQYKQAGLGAAVSVGSSILGALLGRKSSRSASTAVRSVGRTAQQRGDIGRAEDTVEAVRAMLVELDAQFESELAQVRDGADTDAVELESITIRPRKGDMEIPGGVRLAWMPWRIAADGTRTPGFDGLLDVEDTPRPG